MLMVDNSHSTHPHVTAPARPYFYLEIFLKTLSIENT